MNNIVLGALLMTLIHVFVWVSTNAQFSEYFKNYSTLTICLLLAIPTSLCGYYSSKYLYMESNSAWSVRFIGSSIGYFIFPLMTWYLLGESMFTTKTILCIFLSLCIIFIQVFM